VFGTCGSVLDERAAGPVGPSYVRHHHLSAYELVPRGNVPLDADIVADGLAASQAILVHPEAGLHCA
jgi:hypothetical protein